MTALARFAIGVAALLVGWIGTASCCESVVGAIYEVEDGAYSVLVALTPIEEGEATVDADEVTVIYTSAEGDEYQVTFDVVTTRTTVPSSRD